MVITKEILKQKIDYIQDEYIDVLYTVMKAFEHPVRKISPTPPLPCDQWAAFLEKFAGSFADTPLRRGEQGAYEVRDTLQ